MRIKPKEAGALQNVHSIVAMMYWGLYSSVTEDVGTGYFLQQGEVMTWLCRQHCMLSYKRVCLV